MQTRSSWKVWALATLALLLTGPEQSEAVKCSAKQKLKLQQLNRTAFEPLLGSAPVGTCADGSSLGYFINEDDVYTKDGDNKDFIIWLGDSEICSGSSCDTLCDGTSEDGKNSGTICDGLDSDAIAKLLQSGEDITEDQARCIYSRAICTSSWWDSFDQITPQTLLCWDDPFFGKYRRAFLPSCTLDWWLGTGHNDATDVKGKNRFKGNIALREIIYDLAYRYNLTTADNIIIGGTRGGAIGAMNNVKQIKKWLTEAHSDIYGTSVDYDRNIMLILDSAWFTNAEKFAPLKEGIDPDLQIFRQTIKNNTMDWFNGISIDTDCLARWGQAPVGSEEDLRFRCFLATDALQFLESEKIVMIQSLYDMIQLQGLGLLQQDAVDRFQDAASYASAAISYIETFGETMRKEVEAVALNQITSSSHFVFTTPCAQHGYIVPTSLHSIEPRTEAIGEFGSVTFQRNYEVWETPVSGYSPKDTIKAFITSNGTVAFATSSDDKTAVQYIGNARLLTCGSFLCGNCITTINPYTIPVNFSTCSQYMIIAYGVSILLVFYLGFCLSYMQVRRFDREVRRYWKRVKAIEGLTESKEQQIEEVKQQMMNEASSMEYRRIHLMVQELTYWAPAKTRRGKPHKILNKVDLTFAPGEVHAIMGPSGSGKSTLLDILSLTRDNGTISGSHYINGVPSDSAECKFLREWLRHNSSYVRQSDVLFPHLTVREHLVHAAWLMLPQYMSSDSKLKRVWQVLRLLELDTCADTICGDGGVTVEGGISGGQRRRVSVATQLLKMPAVLLLDEPTSGLDSTNALLLIKALHTFAHEGSVNVLMTIHQPRKEIFEYFDSLSFLVAGKVIFSGAASDAALHFRLPQSTKNIANDILDVLQSCDEATTLEFESNYVNGPLGEAVQDKMEAEISELKPGTIESLKEVLVENSLAEGRWSWSESSSASMLSWVLMSRTFKRGGFDLFVTSSLSIVGGVMVGLLFAGSNSYTSRTALVYLVVATQTFLQGTFLGDRYLGEKFMYDHEADAGTFRNWAAFLISQFVRDCVTSSVEGMMFALPAFWIGGLYEDHIPMDYNDIEGYQNLLERFGLYMLLMVLTSFVVICQNVFIEVDRNDLRIASMLQIGLLGFGALFNGFIVRLDDLPVYFSWVPYIMVTYWSFAGALINDFTGLDLQCDLSILECAARTGDVVLRSLSYDNRDVFFCIIVLVAFVVIFRSLAVIDFYLRYVHNRGSTMKRESKDQLKRKASSPLTRGITRQNTKNTMDAMLEAATPTMKRQDTTMKRSDSSISGTPHALRAPPSPSVSAFDLGGKSNKQDSLPEVELAFYNEETNQLSFVQSRLVGFLLDRNLFMLWFFIDFYSSAYICNFESYLTDESVSSVPIGLLAVSMIFATSYALFFFFQLFALIPTTLDGKLDCTWAGGYDALAGLTLVTDIALSFQAANSSSSFEVQLVLAGIIRFLRLVRVYVYWNKVDFFHFVRARSFLDLREEIIEELAEANLNSSRLSSPADFGGHHQQTPNSRPAVPPSRPQRPTRPPRPVGDSSSSPVPPPLRGPNRISLSVRNMKRISLGLGQSPVSSSGGSPAIPPSRPARPERPARPVNRPLSSLMARGGRQSSQNVQASEVSSMWRPIGNGYMYNPHTGQTLPMNQIISRRAPPPPPGNR